ncbi:hypothetical protein JCM11251_001838 [Rhodosporidiobolus azoricus]
MLYVATSHSPSAQLQALSLPFFAPGESSLVINKLNRIEFYEIEEGKDGAIRLREEIAIHGGIAVMEKVQLEASPDAPTASLLVLTTSLQLFLLQFSPTTSSITTLSTVSIHEPFARLSEYQTILVSPCGTAAVVYAYDGLVRVVPLKAEGTNGTAGKKGKKRRASAVDAEEGKADEGAEAGPQFDLGRSYNVRLPHLNVLSLAFVPPPPLSSTTDEEETAAAYPALSVLSLSPLSGMKTLTTYSLSLANKELDDSTAPMGETGLEDAGSEILLPWASENGKERGVVVVGEESITFYGVDGGAEEGKGKGKGKGREEERTAGGGRKVVGRMPVSRVTACAPLSATTLLLGDLYGKLLLVTFALSGHSASITVEDLGDATSPTSIVPLSSSGLVYLASRFGDSQVIRIPSSAFGVSTAVADEGEKMQIEGGEGKDLELVKSFTGLAPILDAIPLGGSGGEDDEDSSSPTTAGPGASSSSSLLLLSGAYKTGSLRLLRRGLGLTELAQLEIEGVQRVWGLSRGGDALLVVGFFGETRVFKVALERGEGGEEEEVDLEEVDDVAPFSSASSIDGASLLAANVGDLLVHVGPSGVYYASATGTGGGGSWQPEGGKKKVTAAVARDGVVAVAVEGGELVVLRAAEGGLNEVGSTAFPTDISALALSPTSSHLAVALWTPSQTVHLLALQPSSLEKVAEHTLSSSFLIRSLALPTFSPSVAPNTSTVLFCGMGDGSLTSFSVSLDKGEIDARTEKTVQLGRRPLLLSEVVAGEAQNEPAVFVACETPTVVTLAKGGRLSYAGVNCGDMSAVCALPLPSTTSSTPLLALSSPTSLTLARLPPSTNSQVSVTTIPLDEDEPRRIAHDRKRPGVGCFAVVCSRRDVDRVTGEQGTTGRVRIMEKEDFSTRATLTLPPQEEGQSITALPSLSHSTNPALSSLTSPSQSLFLLGTTKNDLSQSEPTEGRLVLLRTTAGSDEIEQLASKAIGGCPYAVVAVKGEGMGEYVAAAVNSQVTVLRLVEGAEGAGGVELEVVATWAGAFVALFLAAAPNGTLVVGDAMRSMAVLRFSLPSSSTPSVSGGATPKPKFEELGKDYRSLYMAQVEALSSSDAVERFIGADTDMNLFTVERDPQAGIRNLANAGTLNPAAAWHLGETVTRFKHGSFGQLLATSTPSASSSSTIDSPSTAPVIRPQLVYTTTAGSVGVILELDEQTSRVLSEVERNMTAVEAEGWSGGKSIGGLEQEAFRFFKTEKQRLPSAGFIDGSFVEQFLDLSPPQQDAVVAGVNIFATLEKGREEVVRLVEEVARAH